MHDFMHPLKMLYKNNFWFNRLNPSKLLNRSFNPFYKQALLFQNDSLYLYLIWIRSILQSIIHIYCISDMMFDIILSPIFPAGFLS